jgi:hypothetical protein
MPIFFAFNTLQRFVYLCEFLDCVLVTPELCVGNPKKIVTPVAFEVPMMERFEVVGDVVPPSFSTRIFSRSPMPTLNGKR